MADHDTATISDDTSIKDDLFVVFKNSGYQIAKENLRRLYDAVIHIKGRMNAKSENAEYTALIGNLREKRSVLAEKNRRESIRT